MANNDVGGSSTKNMMHWAQMVRSSRVAQYDYGPHGNLEVYGALQSPLYQLESLKGRLAEVPILLFSGEKDVLVPPQNLEKLLDLLPKTRNQDQLHL